MTDRNVALAELSRSVAAIMDIGVAGLADEKKIDLANSLASGAGEVRITIFMSHGTIIAELVSTADPSRDQELFRVVDMPKDEVFN